MGRILAAALGDARSAPRPLEGVLLLDKPVGPTSHDMVALARRVLGIRRIGHTGTLDPFASGLLLLCLGRATRLAEYLTALSKVYRATARLGVSTDTLDRTGRVIARSEAWRDLDRDRMDAALRSQHGEIQQTPPAFSAKKVSGEALHRKARRGETVEPAPVPVRIDRLDLLCVSLPDLDFEVECSSGTYVRAIARDFGEALGTGAHLTSLRRVRIGSFDVADALAPRDLEDRATVAAALLPPLEALSHLPELSLDDADARLVLHGGTIRAPEHAPAGVPIRLARRGQLVAIGERDGECVRPRKVLADA